MINRADLKLQWQHRPLNSSTKQPTWNDSSHLYPYVEPLFKTGTGLCIPLTNTGQKQGLERWLSRWRRLQSSPSSIFRATWWKEKTFHLLTCVTCERIHTRKVNFINMLKCVYRHFIGKLENWPVFITYRFWQLSHWWLNKIKSSTEYLHMSI